jgi:hypothetical protein
MLKMLNAISAQVDDPDAAVAEILEQLDLDRNLLDNSIGLAACSYEFIDPGTLEKLAGPFLSILPGLLPWETPPGGATAWIF